MSVCRGRVTSTNMRSRLPSPSESNSVSTHSVCRIHCGASWNAGTICAWPSTNTGLAVAAAGALCCAPSRGSASAAIERITERTERPKVNALRLS